MTRVLLFADENGDPLPSGDVPTHIVFRSDDEREQTLTLRYGESIDDARDIARETAPLGWLVSERRIYAGDTLLETIASCLACGEPATRLGEDAQRYCAWCYDSTGRDPGALQGIDPEN